MSKFTIEKVTFILAGHLCCYGNRRLTPYDRTLHSISSEQSASLLELIVCNYTNLANHV